MKLTTYTPKNFIDSILDENFFNEFLRPFGTRSLTPVQVNGPLTNISETENELLMTIPVPGINKADIKISVENGNLNIQHSQEYNEDQSTEKYIRKEWGYSSFSRSFKLPENSLDSEIESKLENGILSIKVPKSKIESKTKLIDIQ